MGIIHLALLSRHGQKKETAAREPICVNLQVLILFNMADQLIAKKSPALYDHSLPGADCADSAQTTGFISELKCQLQKFSILLDLTDDRVTPV